MKCGRCFVEIVEEPPLGGVGEPVYRLAHKPILRGTSLWHCWNDRTLYRDGTVEVLHHPDAPNLATDNLGVQWAT